MQDIRPINKIQGGVIAFALILAGTATLAVTANGIEQSHPLSEIIVNQNLDMNDRNITNVDRINGQRPSELGGGGELLSGNSTQVNWYKCADSAPGGLPRDTASCSVSCPADEDLVAYGHLTEDCASDPPPWYDDWFQVSARVMMKYGTAGQGHSASVSEFCDGGLYAYMTVNIACVPSD